MHTNYITRPSDNWLAVQITWRYWTEIVLGFSKRSYKILEHATVFVVSTSIIVPGLLVKCILCQWGPTLKRRSLPSDKQILFFNSWPVAKGDDSERGAHTNPKTCLPLKL